jgi:hypothetical protein
MQLASTQAELEQARAQNAELAQKVGEEVLLCLHGPSHLFRRVEQGNALHVHTLHTGPDFGKHPAERSIHPCWCPV